MNNEFDPFRVREDVFHAGPSKSMLRMAQPHTHSQVELNLLLSGEAAYAFQGRELELRGNDLALFWGAFPHQTIRVAPKTRFICIYVPVEMFLGLKLSTRLQFAVLAGGMVVARRDGKDAASGLRLDLARLDVLHHALVEEGAPMSELDHAELELCLRRIDRRGWNDLTRPDDRAEAVPCPARSAKVIAMIRHVLAHAAGPLRIADVAKVAGLHENHAMSVFRHATGMTIGGFLTRCRLHKAQELLLSTNRDVTSIAFEVGFNSLSRFYESFGQQVGQSPRRFRISAQVPYPVSLSSLTTSFGPKPASQRRKQDHLPPGPLAARS